MSTRGKSAWQKETNSTVYKKLRRTILKCSLCPPNRGENKKSHKKYVSKPKKK